jgi:hypothetical protein
MGRVSSQEDTL